MAPSVGKACLPGLRLKPFHANPSLLLCDFGNLEREIARLTAAGLDMLHLDCMDGQFVQNFSYGLTIVEAIRKLTPLPLDVHVMMLAPERYVPQFAKAGADLLTIHVEATTDPAGTLQAISAHNMAAGLAFNPATPVAQVEPYLELCDQVLVMSVQPGFGGQKFDPGAIEKLRYLRSRLPPEVLLSIDGGVNEATLGPCVAAGARLLVMGSAIFGYEDYAAQVRRLEQIATDHLGRETV